MSCQCQYVIMSNVLFLHRFKCKVPFDYLHQFDFIYLHCFESKQTCFYWPIRGIHTQRIVVKFVNDFLNVVIPSELENTLTLKGFNSLDLWILNTNWSIPHLSRKSIIVWFSDAKGKQIPQYKKREMFLVRQKCVSLFSAFLSMFWNAELWWRTWH